MADWKAPGIATVSPFIMTTRPAEVVDFAVEVLGARLVEPPLKRTDGSIWHAALSLADGSVMVSGVADPAMERPGFVHLYVPDADAAFGKAVAAGATVMMPVADQFYGERAGGVIDPAGNIWWFATFKERVPREELERRAAETERAREGG